MKKRMPVVAFVTTVVIGGALMLALKGRGPDPAQLVQYKVATVERGPVRKTVSSTGTLQPWTTVDIKSKAGGRVLEMMVDVGSRVTSGQIIARIDPSDTLLSVNQAEADITSATAKKEQSLRTYQLQVEQTRIAIRNAESALQAARDSRSAAATRLETARRQAKVQPTLTKSAIAQARASYDQAVKQRSLLDATNKQQKASAQSAYDQAVANARQSETEWARQESLLAKGFVSQQAVDNARASHEVAQAQVHTARVKRDTLAAELQANVDTADARVAQAKAALQTAQANQADIQTRDDALREAQAVLRQSDSQVRQMEQSLNQARANTQNDAIRRLDIASAQANQTRSQAAWTNARETLDQTTVRAPSEGVILTKYVDTGTIITSGLSLNSTGSSIVQLGDTTRMYVDVTVDETDIASVDQGQKVEVSMDAYPGVPFEGKVARIDPQAVAEQNVTMIHVRVEVDNTSPTFRLLKPGMNATCDFVVDELEDATLVPNGAVQTSDQGSYVQVVSAEKTAKTKPRTMADGTVTGINVVRRPVVIGLEGDEATQITEGLTPGETVVVQTIGASAPVTKSSSPFGGGGPGGPPPPGR